MILLPCLDAGFMLPRPQVVLQPKGRAVDVLLGAPRFATRISHNLCDWLLQH
jgi:hypothetical protein